MRGDGCGGLLGRSYSWLRYSQCVLVSREGTRQARGIVATEPRTRPLQLRTSNSDSSTLPRKPTSQAVLKLSRAIISQRFPLFVSVTFR